MEKFLVVSYDRYGYQYLRSLMLNHDDLLIHGDVWSFLNPDLIDYNPYHLIDQIYPHLDELRFIRYIFNLSHYYFPNKMIGFKTSPFDFKQDMDIHSRFWRDINRQGVKLIFLNRKDKFLAYLSNCLARTEGNYWLDVPYTEKTVIDVNKYIIKCQLEQNYWNLVRRRTPNCPKLDIAYEDLCETPQNTVNQVYTFLEKPVIDVNSVNPSVKQMDKPAHFYVENAYQAFSTVGKAVKSVNISDNLRYYLKMAYKHAPQLRKNQFFV